MSKMIRLTGEEIEKLRNEFEKAISGALPDGKVSFTKAVGALNRKAELRFTEVAWYKMQALIRACDKEVGWHGIAKRLEEEGKDAYLIEDILVYPQAVTGVTVTPDQTQYQNWLMRHPDEVFNNIRMQGHSHVNMGTSPSGTDTAFYEEILRQLDDTMFYVFLIWNKRNEHYIKIYDMQKNVLFENGDVTVSVIPAENGIEQFVSDAKKMISEYKPPVKPAPTKTETKPEKKTEPSKKQAKKRKADNGRRFEPELQPSAFKTSTPVSVYGNRCEDDDPYGPFGYWDYYGYGYHD